MPNTVISVSDPVPQWMGETPTFYQRYALEAHQKPVSQRRRKARCGAYDAHYRAEVRPIEVRMADQLVDS